MPWIPTGERYGLLTRIAMERELEIRKLGSVLTFDTSQSANRNYPIADPKSRLLSRGARKRNASHRAADAAGGMLVVES